MSLRPSVLNYKWENGRRYHAYEDGSYWSVLGGSSLDYTIIRGKLTGAIGGPTTIRSSKLRISSMAPDYVRSLAIV